MSESFEQRMERELKQYYGTDLLLGVDNIC